MATETTETITTTHQSDISIERVGRDGFSDRRYHLRKRLNGYSSDEDSIVRRIAELDGIESVVWGQYSVTVTKAKLFEWDEIEPSILELLRSA